MTAIATGVDWGEKLHVDKSQITIKPSGFEMHTYEYTVMLPSFVRHAA